jgi:hypothetical protein
VLLDLQAACRAVGRERQRGTWFKGKGGERAVSACGALGGYGRPVATMRHLLGSTHNPTSPEPTKGLETPTPRHAPAPVQRCAYLDLAGRPDTGYQAAAPETATRWATLICRGFALVRRMWTRLFRPSAPNPRGTTTTSATKHRQLIQRGWSSLPQTFFFDLSSSSVLKIQPYSFSFSPPFPLPPPPPSYLLRLLRCFGASVLCPS